MPPKGACLETSHAGWVSPKTMVAILNKIGRDSQWDAAKTASCNPPTLPKQVGPTWVPPFGWGVAFEAPKTGSFSSNDHAQAAIKGSLFLGHSLALHAAPADRTCKLPNVYVPSRVSSFILFSQRVSDPQQCNVSFTNSGRVRILLVVFKKNPKLK